MVCLLLFGVVERRTHSRTSLKGSEELPWRYCKNEQGRGSNDQAGCLFGRNHSGSTDAILSKWDCGGNRCAWLSGNPAIRTRVYGMLNRPRVSFFMCCVGIRAKLTMWS